MSGVRNFNNADASLQELVKEENNREYVGRIDPDIAYYEGSGSQTNIRQSASQRNPLPNAQSGMRVQSPTLSYRSGSNQEIGYVQPNSPTNIRDSGARSSGVRSPGLPPSLSQQGTQLYRVSEKEIVQNTRIKEESVHRGSSVGISPGSGTRFPLAASGSGVRPILPGVEVKTLPLGMHQNHLIKERNQRFFSDHTVNKESKIEYVPFERKVIDYEERQRVETVPKKRIITEYEERIKEELVPRVITKHDYYAVEYIKEYVAEQIPEKSVRMVERKVPYKRIEYVPVTRQVVHYHGDNNQQGLQMVGGSAQGYPVMGGHFANANQYAGPSFYQNYSGNFFTPVPTSISGQSWNGHIGQQMNTGAHLIGSGTQEYRRGIEELSKYSSAECKGYKLRKNYNLYDHYETYIPSFQY